MLGMRRFSTCRSDLATGGEDEGRMAVLWISYLGVLGGRVLSSPGIEVGMEAGDLEGSTGQRSSSEACTSAAWRLYPRPEIVQRSNRQHFLETEVSANMPGVADEEPSGATSGMCLPAGQPGFSPGNQATRQAPLDLRWITSSRSPHVPRPCRLDGRRDAPAGLQDLVSVFQGLERRSLQWDWLGPSIALLGRFSMRQRAPLPVAPWRICRAR